EPPPRPTPIIRIAARPGLPPKPPPPPPRVSYEAADFLPITDKELKKQAATPEVASSPWWGRIDTIPPGDDPRTKLIDRALVTRGYLTPEQLVEIHRVGDLDLLYRKDETLFRQEANRAVVRMKEERAALKAKKKLEAEDRRRLHAAKVAERKAEDIVFLGAGVSRELSHRESDPVKLGKLPALSTPAEVAKALGLTIKQLRWLAFHSDAATVVHYRTFQIPKKSGGLREISAPMERLAAAQRWILQNVLVPAPALHPSAHGFVAGRSTVTNARPHVKRAAVVNLDLEAFFPSITFPRVRGLFRKMGYSGAVSTIFALLCTESPRRVATYDGRSYHVALGPRALPQGACTSPALSNIVGIHLDARLDGFAKTVGWTYTRYADDLTFSGDTLIPKGQQDPRSIAWLIARVRHLVENEGFAVNEKKLRVHRRNRAQAVTGVIVNEKPSVTREERRRLRAILHRAKFEGIAAQNRIGHPNFEAYLRGHVAYVTMVNADQGRRLKTKLDALK
ncbi:MAG TPA: reverse transcriptase family protein, partial [Planctomycetota bacterium]|nr:reverse transcriptase family protein [Planctomycetota bacterium]